jgi:hypothetical protein
MNCKNCLTCAYSNTLRQNDLGEIRCQKFSTFVKPSECCSFHITEGIKELQDNLKRGEQNAR